MRIEWQSVIFGLDFVIAYVGGVIILIVICYERFGQPVAKKESFVSTLLPAHLATKQDYLKSFLIYLFIMLTFYTVLSVVGPKIYQAFQIEKSGNLDFGTTGYSSSVIALWRPRHGFRFF